MAPGRARLRTRLHRRLALAGSGRAGRDRPPQGASPDRGTPARRFFVPTDRTADLGDQRIQLSPLEFGVLAALSERPGRAVTRAELIEQVWGTTYVGGSNVVDVVVRSLRQKLGPMANRVETARGVGYRLS